ncbi:M20/M25/M40 family metallo-hydrolase [Sandaracinomonas limnophila]|uniref:Carboxypeptidase Q n=1 Tax=Sandaracinomonas limnophila TaxID=1862386 RepID=A0A437PTR3_9BACT|nr:M20/M25/M40 family metallo-hydrolase [Sandaracinomonas limnophila]RVU25655.1 M20/M25/M40 family metallo-hydrolase [Sandaracinomonas limnophila]
MKNSNLLRSATFLAIILIASSFTPIPFIGEESLESVFKRIKNEVESNSQAYDNLGNACKTLGHRLTGSLNGKKAEEYAYNLFKKYGFRDTKYQGFQVEAWARDTVTLQIGPPKSDNIKDVKVVSLAMTPVEANINGSIIDAGNGLDEDFEKIKNDVTGKIVLMNIGLLDAKPGQKNLHRSEKTALAIKNGAIGVIFANTVKGEVLLTGTASVTGNLISIPAVCVSLESGMEIRNWLQSQPKLLAMIEMHNVSKPIKARNVVATLKGENSKLKHEKIVIGGHLDSWDLAQGAIDNGLGSFSVIDIARTFKALGLKSKRTIEFVAFMGEEEGLLGSKAYIERAKKTGELEDVVYMINLDMTNNVYGFNAGGRNELLQLFKDLGDKVKAIDPEFGNQITNAAGLHSDNQSFLLEGIPAGTPNGKLEKGVLDCYHANCDGFSLVNKKEMENTVKYTAMLLYGVANTANFPAKKLDFYSTKDFFIKQNLRRELELGNEWRWGND